MRGILSHNKLLEAGGCAPQQSHIWTVLDRCLMPVT